MNFATIGMSATLFGIGLLGLTGEAANAATVRNYEAGTGALPGSPSYPDWSQLSGSPMTNAGTVLKQQTVADADSSYQSTPVAGLMVNGSTDYSIEFNVKVVADTPGTDWYTNAFLAWSDNTAAYTVTLGKNAPSSTTPRSGLLTGSGTSVGNLSNVATGVDWSTSHNFIIAYTGSSNTFNVYVDGTLANTLPAAGLQAAGSISVWENRIIFGDNLTGGGGATEVDWSAVRLHNVALAPAAVPEPTTLAMGAVVVGGALLRRRGQVH